MEALVFDKASGVLKHEKNRKVPVLINDNDIIVKVEYSGLCGTDLHIIEGAFPCNDKRPFVMGHEFCGVVQSAGLTAHFKPGQRVVVDPNSGCGVCRSCHSGRYHLCEFGGIHTTVGIWADGGWAQFCRVPDTQVFSLPDEISFCQGALCEPLSCLAHGWDRAGQIPIGDDILIIGAGIIGCLWSQLFHVQGHRNVTVSEMNETRLASVKKMGLNFNYCTPSDVKGSGKHFDVIVDCTGVAKVLEDSMMLLKRSGRYVVFGCSNPKDVAKINPFEVYMKESTIIGVNINPFTFPKALGLLQSMGDRYIKYDLLGIGVFSLSQFGEAIDQLKKGKLSKAVFKI
ncbi:D-altritol 5-dehydrogenase-like [Arctopsyche grandis]|uniref:D-altritol 5-dehydrogenase-like n=1 Tax=Arctopsyche grandis TaxID=121162 RepID=UPI00406D8E09